MNSLRCIIVDDNELDRIIIANYFTHFPEFQLIEIFNHPLEALEAIKNELPDIIFLDVNMPEMTGLELRKQVAQIPICIFTTDHPEYAVESFELNALDYLLKPYSLDRFTKTIDRIKEYKAILSKATQYEMQFEEQSIFVKSGYQKIKVILQDVIYLNSLQNYTMIYTNNQKYCISSTIGTLLTEKKMSAFLRVHKSFAVNKFHIHSISSKEIKLTNGTLIPIGRSYKLAIEKALKDII